VRAGTVRHLTGTYEEYVAELATAADETAHTAVPPATDPDAIQRRERKERAREIQRAQKRIEERMKSLDAEKSAIMAFFFENPTDYAPDKATRLAEINEELGRLEGEWLEWQKKE